MKERLKRWLRFSRLRALVVALFLLSVPTFFTVVPGWTKWNGKTRTAILVVWVLAALLVVAGEIVRDETLDELSSDRRKLLKHLRVVGFEEALAALLQPGTRGMPEQYEFTLYIHDDEVELLVPLYPNLDFRGGPDPRVFAPGLGATGTAWERQRTVVVTGIQVVNDHYGLTPEQQEYFKDYKTVASAVVWEELTTPIGVLTALSKRDDGYFNDAHGRDTLQVLADVLGVLVQRVPEPGDFG